MSKNNEPEFSNRKAKTKEPEQIASNKSGMKDTEQDNLIKGPDGKPLTVYHGMPAEFDTFDQGKLGKNTGSSSSKEGFLPDFMEKAMNQTTKASLGWWIVYPMTKLGRSWATMRNYWTLLEIMPMKTITESTPATSLPPR